MSIIDPEEGHFKDVDGYGVPKPSTKSRSFGPPADDEWVEYPDDDAKSSDTEESSEQPPHPDETPKKRTPRHSR